MNAMLSDDTKAILLLTAPLIAGPAGPRQRPLTLGDYKHLARKLRELGRKPADLIAPSAEELIEACGSVVDAARLRELLARGFQMAQAVERWSARAIWVISRADESYPRRWKERLKEDCPPILYGCGDAALLARGGLAIVGSRHADDDTLAWTRRVGATAAEAGISVVSGGARGIDDAAVRGGLDAGGRGSVILADSLEREATNKANRQSVMNHRLVIVSPYDPAARFNVGHAMGRNKLVHCLADASLVVRCDAGSGGTWSGAVEHLGRDGATPLYVRNGAEAPEGNRALLSKRASPWPEPTSVDTVKRVVETNPVTKPKTSERSLFPDLSADVTGGAVAGPTLEPPNTGTTEPAMHASRRLYEAARPIILELLLRPYGEKELATALGIPPTLAKTWLTTLMVEDGVEKAGRPVRYRLRAATTLPSDTAPSPQKLGADPDSRASFGSTPDD